MQPSTTTQPVGEVAATGGTKLPEQSTTDGAPNVPHRHDPGRSPQDIRAIIVAHRDEARACYDKSLAAHPGVEGDLVIQWTIDPQGTVTHASVDPSRSQIAEPGAIGCILAVVQRIQFAPSKGGFETKASYPFNFHPRQGPRPGGP